MVRTISIVMVCFFAAAGIFISTRGASAEQAVDAKEIAPRMDKTKYASAEIKSYLKDLKDKEVIAGGKIDEILTGKTGTRVVVHVDVPNTTKNFVVDVYVESAEQFHKGDTVSCRGKYSKYNMFTLNGITLKGSCKK